MLFNLAHKLIGAAALVGQIVAALLGLIILIDPICRMPWQQVALIYAASTAILMIWAWIERYRESKSYLWIAVLAVPVFSIFLFDSEPERKQQNRSRGFRVVSIASQRLNEKE
jgi:predicted membrane metal-binding protein